MKSGESTQNLPDAEQNGCYLSDESNDFDDVKRMQINIQYDTPARG